MCVGLDLQSVGGVWRSSLFHISISQFSLFPPLCEGHDGSGRRGGTFQFPFSVMGCLYGWEFPFLHFDVYFYLGVFIVCISNDTRLLEWF